MKTIAIILASGSGERFGLDVPKQFVKIEGKTILEHAIEAFENHKLVDEIILVTNPDYIDLSKEIILKNSYKKITKVLKGGKTRKDSSYNGIMAINEKEAGVLIHDAARPFVDSQIIENCILALDKYKAICTAIESVDTLVEIDENNIVQNIPNRKFYMRAQTPQAFDLKIIKKAHELAQNAKDLTFTDDCGLVNQFALAKIFIVKGNEKNNKITYPIDIEVAGIVRKI